MKIFFFIQTISKRSSSHSPKVHIPLRRLIHIIPVVYEEFLPLLNILQHDNGGDLPKARVERVCPLTVWFEAVVYLVSQG